jgi:hypothetical protein
MDITDEKGVDYAAVLVSARRIVNKPQENWPMAGWDAYNLALACLDYEKRIAALKAELAAERRDRYDR